MSTAQASEKPATENPVTIESAVENAKRAFALKKYEQAVEHYSTALEHATQKYGDSAPETANLYYVYGQALLENAIAQSSVLGKEQPEESEDDNKASTSVTKDGPILSFEGDADDLDEEGTNPDPAVDLFANAEKAVAEADAAEQAEGDDDDETAEEPEDDFNAAWEMFEMAKSIYRKQASEKDAGRDVKLKLADAYVALGDVSLETEKFDQAILDYEEGLGHKLQLLPESSRQIAEAHYKLCIVLDLTSGRLSDAIMHAEKALKSLRSRSQELQAAESSGEGSSPKGEGMKAMSKEDIERELKELDGLQQDIVLKIEELKTSPNEPTGNAADMVAQALDNELNAKGVGLTASQVNDLTTMVKKKKKPVDSVEQDGAVNGKRKADEAGVTDETSSDKKVKLDTP